MKISEFADSRGIKQQTVYKYIQRHGWSYDAKFGLTEEQLAKLDEQYPLPKPVTIITGLPHEEERALREELDSTRKQVVACQNVIIDLQEKVSEVQYQLNDSLHNAEILAIEDKHKDAQIEDLRAELEKARAELEAEKSRTWLDKLLHR